MNLDLQPFGEGVDYAGAHAVKSAGDLIAAAAELSSGVQHSKHHLQGGASGLGLGVHGDTAAIIGDSNGVSLVDGHGNLITESGQGLVDCVVDNFVYQMVQSRFAGGADIHAGPFPDGLQSLQNLNFRTAVFVFHLGHGGAGHFHHVVSFINHC